MFRTLLEEDVLLVDVYKYFFIFNLEMLIY